MLDDDLGALIVAMCVMASGVTLFCLPELARWLWKKDQDEKKPKDDKD